MKEKPIIFNTEDVMAILAGRKTQTRRVINPKWKPQVDREYLYANSARIGYLCPYGQPGDRLWVRETWLNMKDPQYGFQLNNDHIIYKANGVPTVKLAGNKVDFTPKWRPSIHMPKWAARIWLEITDVRVERLQDITAKDVEAEGMSVMRMSGYGFKEHWNSIHTQGWQQWWANPWVWVISFSKIDY